MLEYSNHFYIKDPFNYHRIKTIEVLIGQVSIGGNNPIAVQSMTTCDTMDTKASVEQCLRLIKTGCEIVRLTAPSIKEAENLLEIKIRPSYWGR